MKQRLITFFILLIVASGMPVSKAFPMGVRLEQIETVASPNLHESGHKKRNKAYKKRKNKKFLGLFKRKSACDCPKH